MSGPFLKINHNVNLVPLEGCFYRIFTVIQVSLLIEIKPQDLNQLENGNEIPICSLQLPISSCGPGRGSLAGEKMSGKLA